MQLLFLTWISEAYDEYDEYDEKKSVPKPGIKPRMEGLDKGGQGPMSGCCAIEEEEEEEEKRRR
jgi:hypothetical protein